MSPIYRDRRADAAAAQLYRLHFGSLILRRALDRADNDRQRELIAGRIDLVDARAADIAARLLETRAA